MAVAFTQIREAWAAAGRTDAPHLSSSIWYALGDGAEARLRDYAFDYMRIFGEGVGKYAADAVACFTPEALRRAVDNAEASGADEFFLVPTTPDPDELARTRDALSM
jgi:hypothetical protein